MPTWRPGPRSGGRPRRRSSLVPTDSVGIKVQALDTTIRGCPNGVGLAVLAQLYRRHPLRRSLVAGRTPGGKVGRVAKPPPHASVVLVQLFGQRSRVDVDAADEVEVGGVKRPEGVVAQPVGMLGPIGRHDAMARRARVDGAATNPPRVDLVLAGRTDTAHPTPRSSSARRARGTSSPTVGITSRKARAASPVNAPSDNLRSRSFSPRSRLRFASPMRSGIAAISA